MTNYSVPPKLLSLQTAAARFPLFFLLALCISQEIAVQFSMCFNGIQIISAKSFAFEKPLKVEMNAQNYTQKLSE
jgi:hypothetical protein